MLKQAAVARERLDARLVPLASLAAEPRPPRGWVRAIREALGMPLQEMANRMGVAKTAAARLEAGEASGLVRLRALREAAHALDCELVYFLVPHTSLDDTVRTQARGRATEQLGIAEHTMRLENEEVDSTARNDQLEQLASSLLDRRGLWTRAG